MLNVWNMTSVTFFFETDACSTNTINECLQQLRNYREINSLTKFNILDDNVIFIKQC